MSSLIAEVKAMTNPFCQYCNDESDATAIEYCFCCTILLASLISILETGGAVGSTYQKLTAVTKALN